MREVLRSILATGKTKWQIQGMVNNWQETECESAEGKKRVFVFLG